MDKYYDAFVEARRKVVSEPYVPYSHSEFQTSNPTWLPYELMLAEFFPEIANSINQLTNSVQELEAWTTVIAPLDVQEKVGVLIHFITERATLALCMPYALRSRFVFAAAHLCHQANRAKEGNAWKDDLPLDEEIHFNVAGAYGSPWKQYTKLKLALEKTANKTFGEQTRDFRNKFNHRFSPRIEVGLTGLVQRIVRPDGGISYGIGQTDPLPLTLVVAVMKEQLGAFRKAFVAFQDLIQEHALAIQASETAA